MSKKTQGNGRSASNPARNAHTSIRRRKKTGASPVRRLLLAKNQWGQTPAWRLFVIDFLALAIALLVFAYFHHVMPHSETVVGVTSSRSSAQRETVVQSPSAVPVSTPTPEPVQQSASDDTGAIIAEPTATPEPVQQSASDDTGATIAEPTATPASTAEPTPTPDPIGYFGTKYADMFTDGEVISNGTSYRSANLNITASQLREGNADVYFIDVYIKDITSFRTEFADGKFGRSIYEWPVRAASRIGSVVCINGDYYGGRSGGVVIRNGILYRNNQITDDVGVLYWDGTMKCFSPNEFDAETEMVNGAYQAWNFGPMLLDTDGNAMTNFNSTVGKRNPRAAIGYFEPGHYCLVVVDGRSDASVGLSLEDLSAFFERVGCKAAYNLDGGATAQMVCGTQLVNNPSGGGRKCSDFVVIVDEIITGF